MYGSVFSWGEFCSSPAFICVAIVLFLAVCLFGSMIISMSLPEREERRSVKLAPINSAGSSTASFLHGIGAGSQSLYQFYAIQDDGAMVLQSLPPDYRITIYEDSELHDTATLTTVILRLDRSKWYAKFGLPPSYRYRYEFRLPVGTVLHTNPNFRVRLDR